MKQTARHSEVVLDSGIVEMHQAKVLDHSLGHPPRPVVGEGTVEDILLRKYDLTVTQVSELDSYEDRNYLVKVEPPESSRLHEDEYKYVLKLLNS